VASALELGAVSPRRALDFPASPPADPAALAASPPRKPREKPVLIGGIPAHLLSPRRSGSPPPPKDRVVAEKEMAGAIASPPSRPSHLPGGGGGGGVLSPRGATQPASSLAAASQRPGHHSNLSFGQFKVSEKNVGTVGRSLTATDEKELVFVDKNIVSSLKTFHCLLSSSHEGSFRLPLHSVSVKLSRFLMRADKHDVLVSSNANYLWGPMLPINLKFR
jgi:hypothetical protein